MGGDRGQAFSLEAITAGLLLVGGLVFALQATAVTPLSASTSSQHLEGQQQATAEGVLATGLDQGSLRAAVLNWDESNDQFYGAPSQAYFINQAPGNRFGDLLERTFSQRGIVFNVYVAYEDDGTTVRQRMVYRGEPSDNAVSATTTLTLYDDDRLYDANERPTGQKLSSLPEGSFYVPEQSTDTGVYAVVRVEVLVWRQ
jgi:hypothetical protein